MFKFLRVVVFVVVFLTVSAQDPAATSADQATPAAAPATQAPPTPTKFGNVDVRLSVSGQNFTVRFAPERQTAAQVAETLCVEKAGEIGVTQENLKVCVANVGDYLQSYVDVWAEEKILEFPVSLNSTQFTLRFIPELRSAGAMALELCQTYANQSQTTFNPDLNTGCVQPVGQFIQRRIDDFFAEKTLELPLTVNNFTFNIRFLPERQNPLNVATKLCVDYAQELELTEETVRDQCIAPINNFLVDRVDTWIRSKILEFNMNIDGNEYTVSFMPERASSVEVAQEFCVRNAKAFELTQENFLAKCVEPVSQHISQTIRRWVENKRLTVPLSVNDKETSITFMPERQSVLYVARDFCLGQANALSLTEDNFVRECVTPVQKLLRDGLTEWVQGRQQQLQQRQQQQQQQEAQATAEVAVDAATATSTLVH